MCYKVENYMTKTQLAKAMRVKSDETPSLPQLMVANAFDHPNLYVIRQHQPELLGFSRWGLIPSWANLEQAKEIWNQTLNCRIESANEKPSFKDSVQKNRILILVGGFFEYRTEGKAKLLHYIFNPDHSKPLAFAGIENSWKHPEKEQLYSTCSIITCPANNRMSYIHNTKERMPLILNKEHQEKWLSNGAFEDLPIRNYIPQENSISDVEISGIKEAANLSSRKDLLNLGSGRLF